MTRQQELAGAHQKPLSAALERMHAEDVVRRIWKHDHTVWQPDPTEITNRLGWLHTPAMMVQHLRQIEELVQAVRTDGFTHALLLGMGGSSLAPEMFRKVFGVADGYLELSVLDSTSPDAVLAHAESLDLARTLFIVSTKSGGTVETLSFTRFFYNRALEQMGPNEAGRRFIAITDPGSKLVDLAHELSFRETFLNDPNIGGRYSALSYFGLVPAALIGVDLRRLLDRAQRAAGACEPGIDLGENPGAWLGAILGIMHEAGRDKLTLIAPPAIASFGDWVEQLVAESTGKEGRGILPVVGEPLATPGSYGNDRLFVHLQLGENCSHTAELEALRVAGQPVVQLHLDDIYDLGEQIFLWEMATAVASYFLQINPFDQPNVEAAKVIARQMLAQAETEGGLSAGKPSMEDDTFAIYGESRTATPPLALRAFTADARPPAYIALMAYVQPTPEIDDALLALRIPLRDSLGVTTTAGYGPRFLHSTGQLHKGDAGHGIFIQFTEEARRDAPIPDAPGKQDSSVTFGTLILAQALGDHAALQDAGRRVLRVHIKGDTASGLRRLERTLRD